MKRFFGDELAWGGKTQHSNSSDSIEAKDQRFSSMVHTHAKIGNEEHAHGDGHGGQEQGKCGEHDGGKG